MVRGILYLPAFYFGPDLSLSFFFVNPHVGFDSDPFGFCLLPGLIVNNAPSFSKMSRYNKLYGYPITDAQAISSVYLTV